jgi:hypothetical protein
VSVSYYYYDTDTVPVHVWTTAVCRLSTVERAAAVP